MFKSAIFCLVFIVIAMGCTNSNEVAQEPRGVTTNQWPKEITERMQTQEDAWNQGDLPSFMGGAYWADDSMLFIGKSGMTWGFDATLQNYIKSYPNPEAMGVLTFDNKHWRALGSDHGMLVGQWLLTRSDSLESLTGSYSLIWERIAGEWLIIADHSSWTNHEPLTWRHCPYRWCLMVGPGPSTPQGEIAVEAI